MNTTDIVCPEDMAVSGLEQTATKPRGSRIVMNCSPTAKSRIQDPLKADSRSQVSDAARFALEGKLHSCASCNREIYSTALISQYLKGCYVSCDQHLNASGITKVYFTGEALRMMKDAVKVLCCLIFT